MATFYIDNVNGNNDFDGLAPERARSDYRDLELSSGDTVLFKRGSFYRDKLYAESYVTYGAYGEGERPTFCGSFDVSRPEDWSRTERENVWKCERALIGDAGNIVFNGSECTATFRWELDELCSQGDFHDTRNDLGDRFKPAPDQKTLYLYSVGNPATVYSHIEAIAYHTRQLVNVCDGITLEGLRFMNSGVHGVAGSGSGLTLRDCAFENIGGCAWSKELKIRFGNAFEIWEKGNDILIENCSFKNVYDSCITHQGPGARTVATHGFICRGCTFENYGMAAFEYRDKLPVNSCFNDNYCRGAGCGFAMLGEELPRYSEIWPEPMGHHIFLWRIPEGSEGGSLEIKGNHFGPAPVGAAIYSIISPEAEAQITLDNNRYTRNAILLNHWGGKSYNDLDTFKRETGKDKNSEYVD